MLLLLKKCGRKVLNQEQIESQMFKVKQNLETYNIKYEIIDFDVDDLAFNYAEMFLTVKTKDKGQFVVLGDNTNEHDLRVVFKEQLPKHCAQCFYAKNCFTALMMPDLIKVEMNMDNASD